MYIHIYLSTCTYVCVYNIIYIHKCTCQSIFDINLCRCTRFLGQDDAPPRDKEAEALERRKWEEAQVGPVVPTLKTIQKPTVSWEYMELSWEIHSKRTPLIRCDFKI